MICKYYEIIIIIRGKIWDVNGRVLGLEKRPKQNFHNFCRIPSITNIMQGILWFDLYKVFRERKKENGKFRERKPIS